MVTSTPPPGELLPERLAVVRLALAAGATPADALQAGADVGPADQRDRVLEELAAAARLGAPLAELVPRTAGDPQAAALVRALAVAERAGAGATEAVDLAIGAVADAHRLRRLLRVRTADARGSARVIMALPVAAAGLLALVDPAARHFWAGPVGWASLLAAAGLWLLALRWSRRIVASLADVLDRVDPLRRAARERSDPARLAALALPAAAAGLLVGGVALAVVGGGLGALIGWRPSGRARAARRDPHDADLPSAESAELLATALESGLAIPAALAEVAGLGPALAREPLRRAARGAAAGVPLGDVLAGTPLAPVGRLLAAAERWGAGPSPALRRHAADLRAAAAAALEEAAERSALRLVFPTTVLLVPAFVLVLIPPLLASGLAGLSGLWPNT